MKNTTDQKIQEHNGMTEQEENEFMAEVRKDGELEKFLFLEGVFLPLAESFVWKTKDGFLLDAEVYTEGNIEILFSALAKKYTDGHYTIFRFTSGYKAGFGTPDIRFGGDDDSIHNCKTSKTIKDAMLCAIVGNKNFQGTANHTIAAVAK